jgi:hypothetical protein
MYPAFFPGFFSTAGASASCDFLFATQPGALTQVLTVVQRSISSTGRQPSGIQGRE